MLRVGILLAQRKVSKLKLHEFVKFARARGIHVSIIQIDFFRDTNAQPFDVLLHKLTDNLVRPEDAEDVKCLKNFCSLHPEMVMVDPLDTVSLLLSRGWMTSFSEAEFLAAGFAFPRAVVVQPSENIVQCLERYNIAFPIVIKPLQACGIAESHFLQIVNSPRGLAVIDFGDVPSVARPSIAQQYVNHGGVLYKCYVVGSLTHIVCKRSTRDMSGDDEPCISFDSQTPLLELPHLLEPSMKCRNRPTEVHEVSSSQPVDHEKLKDVLNQRYGLTQSAAEKISQVLREKLGLSLFGYDVVVETNSNIPYVVDVNYFPGYHGVNTFFPELLDHLCSCKYSRHT